MAQQRSLTQGDIADFLRAQRLPSSFRHLITKHYMPMVSWLADRQPPAAAQIVGINGAQGTGKSTLAAFLQLALESEYGRRVAVLSIDDFYLTKVERNVLAKHVHPLLATRGVPGTHDVPMLLECLCSLRKLGPGEQIRLPRFSKANDDRADTGSWPSIGGPIDLIILEGWCVGSIEQSDAELVEPVNDLERAEDRTGVWREYVNEQLRTNYAKIWSMLDVLIVLQAPSFAAANQWRLEQEQKLSATAAGNAPGIMSAEQVKRFIQYYERITRNDLARLHHAADVVFEFDKDHRCLESRYQAT